MGTQWLKLVRVDHGTQYCIIYSYFTQLHSIQLYEASTFDLYFILHYHEHAFNLHYRAKQPIQLNDRRICYALRHTCSSWLDLRIRPGTPADERKGISNHGTHLFRGRRRISAFSWTENQQRWRLVYWTSYRFRTTQVPDDLHHMAGPHWDYYGSLINHDTLAVFSVCIPCTCTACGSVSIDLYRYRPWLGVQDFVLYLTGNELSCGLIYLRPSVF